MAITTPSRLDLGPMTLEIERAGRRYPELPDTATRIPREQVRKLRTEKSDETLPGRLADSIWERLAWHDLQKQDDPDPKTVVAAYIEGLKQLAGFREDFMHVVEAACRANLEFRQSAGETNVEARDEILKAKLEEMMAKVSGEWLPARNIASAQLLSQPREVYRPLLDASLADAASDFATQLFDTLATLVDRELCGLVEWIPKKGCRYHFFRRVVIQGEMEESQTRVETRFDEDDYQDTPDSPHPIVGNIRTTNTKSWKHQIRYARHEHEVIDAIRTSIGNSKVVMPPQVVHLVETIPSWLRPFVEIIDGVLIRERIIERDVAIEDWTRQTTQDEPIMGDEPGVIIGPYVLSGWGPSEVQQELERRQSVVEANQHHSVDPFARVRAPLLAACAVVLGIVAIWSLYQGLMGNGGVLIGLLAAAVAAGCAWQSVSEFASLNPDKSSS